MSNQNLKKAKKKKKWIGWVDGNEIEKDFNTMMCYTKILRHYRSPKYKQLTKVKFTMEEI